jgi:uridine kinase
VDPADLLALVRDRPATLGTGRLLCIDGPSGAGKTTLATAVARLEPSARVVHMDALYDGWGGLPRVDEQLGTLLEPLAGGAPGRYRRYDWHVSAYAETVTVSPTPLLVLEGVGSWSPSYAHLVTALVWVDAPAAERMARAVARDGAEMAEHLRQWTIDEQEHLARTGARDRADVMVVAP